ncbi:MAG TPA: ATP-binding protein [Myxococcales bacterium]|nr:ATP-binding protein [Myxococcales bacterium]
MASAPRRAVRRQIALLWAGGLALCLVPAILIAAIQVGLAVTHHHREPFLPERLAWILGGGAAAAWLLGVVVADRSLGPTLDRLQATVDAAAGLELPHEAQGLRLTPSNLTSAFGQLGHRLAEANASLRAQVERLEKLNAELQAAREELLRAERLATIGRLAAGVGHEIGNPLGALLGYVEVARADPRQAAEVVEAIGVQAQRIHETLQELMDFARPGKMELAAIPLPRALEGAVRLVRAHPRWRSMELSLDLAEDLPAVRANEHQLVQVLVNLLLNAADACEGRGHVQVVGTRAGEAVELEIADDGPGFPDGLEAQIFEPFFTTKERGHGTGLGLAICRQLMESFDGSIRAARGSPGAIFKLGFRVAA